MSLQPPPVEHDAAVTASSYAPVLLLAGSMALLQFLASICYPIAKYGLDQIGPFTFAFYRFILSSVVLLSITRLIKRRPPIEKRDWWRIGGLGVLIIPFNQTLFLVGQSLTGAGHGAFLFATTPVWIFLLAIIHLKERPHWRRTLGIVIATAGVLGIMWAGLADVGTRYLFGDLIILVSVMAWAYYTILGKPLVRKYGAIRITAYALAIGSALYLPFGFFSAINYDYSKANLAAWGSVVYMALGLSVIVYVMWYWLLKHLEASRIAVYHNVQPIIASAVAYLFLGEPLSTGFVIGGLVVLSGVIITET
jgi:drug/metabolite transporter (DMT)-like permease